MPGLEIGYTGVLAAHGKSAVLDKAADRCNPVVLDIQVVPGMHSDCNSHFGLASRSLARNLPALAYIDFGDIDVRGLEQALCVGALFVGAQAGNV